MFSEDNITKRSDLEAEDSISAYDHNFACQQNPHCYKLFYDLIGSVKPARILEIGTALGGLTSFLKFAATDQGLDTIVRSYDIHLNDWYERLCEEDGVDIRVENIFEHDYMSLKDLEVVEFIQGDGVTLILCDGGNKVKEFDIFSDYMKSSDIIMAHDYAYDKEVFEKDIYKKYWNWHEISESDIAEAAERNNLSPFMQEEATKAVWVCKIKA